MKKVWIGRLLLFCAPLVIAAIILELWLRAQVSLSGVTPFQLTDLAGVAHELRPNFTTLYKGQDVVINDRGFRDSDPATWPADRFRLALTGDSFIFGNALPMESTLPILLEERLREDVSGVQVLNCGIPGYNSHSVRQLLEHRVLPMKPDYVVYVFVSNDVDPSRRPAEIPPDASIDSFHGFPFGSALLQWLGVTAKHMLRQMGRDSDSGSIAKVVRNFHGGGRKRVGTAITAMNQLCVERGVPFLVATYPFLSKPNPYAEIDDWVAGYCRAQGIPAIDLRKAYSPDAVLTEYWANMFDPHPNRESNILVADYLAEQLSPELIDRVPGQ